MSISFLQNKLASNGVFNYGKWSLNISALIVTVCLIVLFVIKIFHLLTSKSAGDSPKSPLKRQDIQLCTILNTVKRQFTHTKKDDILCTSNFSMYIFSNSEARIQTFLHLTKPDSIVFHSYITLWLIVAQRSLHCKATVFVVRVFSFL